MRVRVSSIAQEEEFSYAGLAAGEEDGKTHVVLATKVLKTAGRQFGDSKYNH